MRCSVIIDVFVFCSLGGVSQPEPPVPEPVPKLSAQLNELKVTPCSQQSKNKILREKGQEASIKQHKKMEKNTVIVIFSVHLLNLRQKLLIKRGPNMSFAYVTKKKISKSGPDSERSKDLAQLIFMALDDAL